MERALVDNMKIFILILATVAMWPDGSAAKRGGKNKRPRPPPPTFGTIGTPPPTFGTIATTAPPLTDCCLQNRLNVSATTSLKWAYQLQHKSCVSWSFASLWESLCFQQHSCVLIMS